MWKGPGLSKELPPGRKGNRCEKTQWRNTYESLKRRLSGMFFGLFCFASLICFQFKGDNGHDGSSVAAFPRTLHCARLRTHLPRSSIQGSTEVVGTRSRGPREPQKAPGGACTATPRLKTRVRGGSGSRVPSRPSALCLRFPGRLD